MVVSYGTYELRRKSASYMVQQDVDKSAYCRICKATTTIGNMIACPEVLIKLEECAIIIRKYAKTSERSGECGCTQSEGENLGVG